VLKVSTDVVNLSELLSRFVLPGVPANSSAHSVLFQVIHAVGTVPMSGNLLPPPPLVGLSVILTSLISCEKYVMSENMANHQCFLCHIWFSICLSSFTLMRTSLLVTLSSQVHVRILGASNHFTARRYAYRGVHCCAVSVRLARAIDRPIVAVRYK